MSFTASRLGDNGRNSRRRREDMPTQQKPPAEGSSALHCSPAVSLGAKMWVQTARDLKMLFGLLPADDVTAVMELVTELWEDDLERVSAAEQALYEIIDNPTGKTILMT